MIAKATALFTHRSRAEAVSPHPQLRNLLGALNTLLQQPRTWGQSYRPFDRVCPLHNTTTRVDATADANAGDGRRRGGNVKQSRDCPKRSADRWSALKRLSKIIFADPPWADPTWSRLLAEHRRARF
jgi:hypothetical protein